MFDVVLPGACWIPMTYLGNMTTSLTVRGVAVLPGERLPVQVDLSGAPRLFPVPGDARNVGLAAIGEREHAPRPLYGRSGPWMQCWAGRK